ncbi:MAG TPA: restriction endonuclease subunit S [Fibrobacteria bacterium]|nr:restriction endonuclease subunit S [Fibrobacteria bacterium]
MVEALLSKRLLSIGDGYRAKNSELSNSGIPFARVANIDNGFHFDEADRFPVADLQKVGEKISRVGDVVFTSKGTVGRFAFVTDGVQEFVYSPQLCYWRSQDHRVINPRFLFYWLNGPEFWRQACAVKGNTDMADYVSLSDQRRMQITLPCIGIQQGIAHILGCLDDKIENNRRMNETLEAMARALFQDWFVDFGPVRAKMEGREPPGLTSTFAELFPDSLDNHGIPNGWTKRPLDQIARFLNGLALQKYPGNGDDDLPVIKIAELRNGISSKTDQASNAIPSEYVIKNGDVLFSWSGSLTQIIWTGGPGALNQHLFKVTSAEYPKWFHYFWVDYHLPEFQAIAASKATTMGHIQRHHLADATVVVSGPSHISMADQVMRPIFDRLIANDVETCRLKNVRDSLLPKLLSGELRISEAERQVP